MPLAHRPARRWLLAAAAAGLALTAPAGASGATADPAGKGCDRLDDAACLLPFPDDAYTVRADTPTGRRLHFTRSEMPRNAKGVPIDPRPYRALDGFSPGSVILTKVPGLDTPAALRRTGPVGLSDLSRYRDEDAPVMVLDAKTGRRWPIWVELDARASSARDTLLEIHPARNFAEGRRYIVVLRNLRSASGRRIPASARFAALRRQRRAAAFTGRAGDRGGAGDRAPTRRRYASIVRTLRRAHVRRDRSLFLAWDFTVASRHSLSARMLHIRDTAFARLGDRRLADGRIAGRAPAFTARTMPLTGDYARYTGRYARVIEGTVTVPCFLRDRGCGPGASFHYAHRGDFLPAQIPGNVQRAHFVCVVPATASAAHPARLVLYGHGLLGRDTEVLTNPDMPEMAAEHNMVFCATPWAGMSNEDIPNAIAVLSDLSHMPSLADRLQQGMLNALYLGRAMTHPRGLATSPLLRQEGRPIVRTGHLYYDGNSQGGIMGGALAAFAPDYTRAVLGVPGMNYSALLPRSVDFDTYATVFDPAYPDELERPLALDVAQLLWDRGEADAYAHHISGDPLPGTPDHQVLMHVAFGDHQVTQYQADVEARTIGARIHVPALAPGRAPQRRFPWGLKALPESGWRGSAIVYWDTGPRRVAAPPLAARPNRAKEDPHEHPRRTPAARRQKSAFLRPRGTVVDTCGGRPCVSRPDVG